MPRTLRPGLSVAAVAVALLLSFAALPAFGKDPGEALWAVILPFVMNTAGWLLTESGRQPWIVQGIMLTKNAVSPSVGLASVIISLTVFVAAYLTLAVVDVMLMIRYSRKEPEAEPAAADGADALVAAVRY